MQLKIDKAPEDISLYFHIPFCTKKCHYCHFYVLPDKDPFKKQLLEGFKLEWEHWLPQLEGKRVVSIYFGGGTPALIGPDAIEEICARIKQRTSHAEITLEANPENIDLALMQGYAKAGINRVSIGIQTLDNQLLKKLGRIHDGAKALEAVWLVKEAGIDNISVDLMYDLPAQTLNAWENTLAQVAELPISHLSLYNLTIEPHTVFFKYRQALQQQLPDEDLSLAMYQMAVDRLGAVGLNQYEISAFAKGDAFSRHNVGYWIGRPFLGFGPSAFSFWGGKRFRNAANLSRYIKTLQAGELPIDFEERLEQQASLRELFAVELRLLAGVNLDEFQQRHGLLDSSVFQDIQKLQQAGWLAFDGQRAALTKQGILFYDSAATEIIA